MPDRSLHPTAARRDRRRLAKLALTLAATATAAAVATPAVAQADSLVFTKADNVWISRSDGSAARPVTSAPNNWAWPSTADDGTIFVAGGRSRINPDGSDADASSEIYHFDQAGGSIGPYVETQGSRSTPACPTFRPKSLRVSPDGTRVSYDLFFCDNVDSFWMQLGNGHPTLISENYATNGWLDNGHILMTHIGPTFGNAAFASYDVADPASSHGPTDDPYLPDYLAAASRNGSRVAVYETNPNIDSSVHNADIRVYATTGNDVTAPVEKCTITINAANAVTSVNASPTFTPDGSRLAWAERDGIHSASTANLDNCATTTPALLVPGGAFPFFGPADASPAPTPNPNPNPNPVPVPPPPPPPSHALAISSSTTRAKLTRKGALTFAVTADRNATVTATGKVALPNGRTVRFAKRHVKLTAHKRARITLKLSRKNAAAVRAALRHGKKLKAKITLVATSAGGHATKLLTLKLKR
jgi:hypothetical protein